LRFLFALPGITTVNKASKSQPELWKKLSTMSITTAQIRGARGILNWSQSDLAERTGISATSIGSIENNQSTPRESTLKAIRQAFEKSGLEFIGKDGVRTKSPEITILRGADGFQKFSFNVYDTILSDDDQREVLQAYVDDRKYADLLGDQAYPHVKRMEEMKEKRFKILQKENDSYFPAKNYAEYRWIPEDQFIAVPFVVYGDNLAVILFEPEPTIIINNYPLVAEAYRMQFYSLWDNALTPPVQLVDDSVIPEKYLSKLGK
jgi:transcriptional regulator with XRE-family HTH domain